MSGRIARPRMMRLPSCSTWLCVATRMTDFSQITTILPSIILLAQIIGPCVLQLLVPAERRSCETPRLFTNEIKKDPFEKPGVFYDDVPMGTNT